MRVSIALLSSLLCLATSIGWIHPSIPRQRLVFSARPPNDPWREIMTEPSSEIVWWLHEAILGSRHPCVLDFWYEEMWVWLRFAVDRWMYGGKHREDREIFAAHMGDVSQGGTDLRVNTPPPVDGSCFLITSSRLQRHLHLTRSSREACNSARFQTTQ